jgi:hypothetical protein
MDRDDILSLDLSALDASTASGLDRSHSAPTFLQSRYVLRQHSCSYLLHVSLDHIACICVLKLIK